jgi:type VI secretion system protein VasD
VDAIRGPVRLSPWHCGRKVSAMQVSLPTGQKRTSQRGRALNEYLKAPFAVIVLVAAACTMIGCAIADAFLKPDPTIVRATVKVADDVNPNSLNRPSPVKTRFYLLKSVSIFESADFFQLKDQDRELLSDDIMARKEKMFKPGEEQGVELVLPPEELSKHEKLYLAVMAGYWDIDNSEWRAVREIKSEETTEVIVSINRSAVSIDVLD